MFERPSCQEAILKNISKLTIHYTPGKINMEPENGPLEDQSFSGSMLIFQNVISSEVVI